MRNAAMKLPIGFQKMRSVVVRLTVDEDLMSQKIHLTSGLQLLCGDNFQVPMESCENTIPSSSFIRLLAGGDDIVHCDHCVIEPLFSMARSMKGCNAFLIVGKKSVSVAACCRKRVIRSWNVFF